MQAAAAPTDVAVPQGESAETRWGLGKRIAFRFFFIYFVLYSLSGDAVAGIPLMRDVAGRYLNFWRHKAVWVRKYIRRLSYDVKIYPNESGDVTHNVIIPGCYLAIAAAGTVLWSAIDRKRANYARLNEWFRLLLRFTLSFGLIFFGLF